MEDDIAVTVAGAGAEARVKSSLVHPEERHSAPLPCQAGCIDTTIAFLPRARHALTFAERIDDAAARRALALRRRPVANRAMYTLSRLGDDGRVWVAASAVEAFRSPQPSRRFLHAVAWLGIESAVVNGVLKRIARRPRPQPLTEHEHKLRIPTDTSFPSGHAASAATMATILSEGSPLAPVWLGLAAGIGASRVHVGVHHATDVVAGWAVGVAFGLVARSTRRTPVRSAPTDLAYQRAIPAR